MCLKYKLPKDEKKQILDGITRKGIEVYKVILVKDGEYRPLFIGSTPYKGTMRADTVDNISMQPYAHDKYKAGFHLFKSKAAAQRYCDRFNTSHDENYKVISAIIKKSWITEIGTEAGFDQYGCISSSIQEVVIVAKKAIFAEKE